MNYFSEGQKEHFNPGRYWIRKGNMFKCADGTWQTRCPPGKYMWHSQASAWGHEHPSEDTHKLIGCDEGGVRGKELTCSGKICHSSSDVCAVHKSNSKTTKEDDGKVAYLLTMHKFENEKRFLSRRHEELRGRVSALEERVSALEPVKTIPQDPSDEKSAQKIKSSQSPKIYEPFYRFSEL